MFRANVFKLQVLMFLLLCSGTLFTQGLAGPDKTICNGEETTIGSDSCPSDAEINWLDENNNVIGDTPKLMVNPTVTTTYLLEIVEVSGIKTVDEVTVYVINSIRYREFDDQKYGLDNFLPNEVTHWKSIRENDSDNCLVEINPPTDLTFEGTNQTIIPMVTLSNGNNPNRKRLLIESGSTGETEISAKSNGEDGLVMISGECDAKMNVVSYPQKMDEAGIVIVSLPGADDMLDIDRDELQEYLNNEVYNQAILQWDIVRIPAQEVNYDIDGNGGLTTVYYEATNRFAMTDEHLKIAQIIASRGHVYKHMVYIVEPVVVVNPDNTVLVNPPALLGTSKTPGTRAYVHTSRLQTCAHELGHNFGLQHPELVDGIADRNNVMYGDVIFGLDQDKLRKNQWDTIQMKE